MSTEPNVVSLAPQSLASVPRAVWVGGGLLGLVTAALAGALIMRSADPVSTPLASTVGAVSATGLTGQPVPLVASAPRASDTAPAPSNSAHPANPAATVASQGPWSAPGGTTRAAICANCGVVESVSPVRKKGQGTGLGVVAGGVLGGVVGHQVGGGKGKTALTVLGAIGGGLAGNEVEKRARSETLFDVRVRMEDGSTRVFQRAQSMAVGTHVIAEGTALRIARDTGNRDAPSTVRTAAPVPGTT